MKTYNSPAMLRIFQMVAAQAKASTERCMKMKISFITLTRINVALRIQTTYLDSTWAWNHIPATYSG